MPDFRLDDLYNVEATLELPHGDSVVVRTLTEAEVQLRDEASLAAGAQVEQRLRDKDGDEYKELIEPLTDMPPEALVEIVMAMEATVIKAQVDRDIPFKFIPYPDDATDEERMQTIIQQEEHEARVIKLRAEVLESKLRRRREELEALDQESLVNIATNSLVQTSVWVARHDEFLAQTVYLASRNGDSKGEPKWPLEFIERHGKKDGLNEHVFQEILRLYAEIDTADPWELQKKL